MTRTIEGINIPIANLHVKLRNWFGTLNLRYCFTIPVRVYYFGALAGKHRGLKFDPELLYTGAMFHDMGLTHQHSSAHERFEVDGANAARDFLGRYGIAQQDIDIV